MSSLPLFEGLEAYTLDKSSIQVTSEELGCGSYATVLKLKYLGLKCAGKKIHNALLLEEKETYAAKRFREECKLLSQVLHPNIVQFLGVFFPNEDEKVPIIAMEYLPMNLTDCIEKHSEIPCEISYSILHDVALGLHYLHSYSPEPVIHRDLSSNNILLTPNMTAKISDLGVARIINISPEKASQLTKTPGTPAFMPPETMVENPVYDSSVDIFSYGAIMIHMLSGMWPEPDTQPVSIVGETMEPVSEAKRRNKHITKIGEDHPLMDLILKCIHNDPKERPTAEMIVKAVSNTTAKCPVSFNNEIDMLRHIEATEARKRAVQNTKEERMQKVEEKSRELQSRRERIEQRAKRQMIELEKVRKQLSDYQMKNSKLGTEISHLKNQITKHNSFLGNAHMLLQDAQKSITDFDEYKSTEALQLNFTLTLPQSSPCSPLLISPPSPSSTAPILPKVEKSHKEEGDHTTNHALNVIKEDDTTSEISSELTVNQSNEDDESEKNLIKISPEELTLNEQIGSGHISIVWKGKLQNNTDVAISELKSGTISTVDFLDQAILLHKLSNSNILKFYGVHTGNPIYIITELMKNNLLNYLQNEIQVLQLSTIIHISVQVTEGMDYLHKQKCIHRNLSARNVLIGENLACKIAGFELAKVAADEVIKVETNFKFPIRSTACETFTSCPHKSTFMSDVWSFGILLWEVNTFGCLPYPGMTNAQVQREVVEGYRMPCPSRHLPELYTIMLMCWRKNPMDRPTFDDLSSKLKGLLPTSDHHLSNVDVESVNVESVQESSIYDCIVVYKEEDTTTNINHESAECKMALITGNYSFKCSQKQSIELTKKVEFTSHSKHYTEGHGKQYADTYKGIWNKTTTVFIKIYSADTTATLTSLQQAANIAELDHPNVVQFYAVLQTKRVLYMVTEYMKTDLLTHLRYEGQSLSLSRMVSMALDIVNGMIYIKDKKYIHRNLKANSIMLGDNSVCKICNFDLAEAINDSKTTYPLTKFPIRWTAPEAIFHCKFSTKSDVWSFGILLWEVVSHGCSPYPEMTLCQVREQLFQGYRMPSPSECKGILYSIMLECWNENPDNRPSFTKLQEILSHYLQEVNELVCDVTPDSNETVTQDENTEKSKAIGNEALLSHNEDASKVSSSPSSPTNGKEPDLIHSTGDSDLTLIAQNHVKNPLYVAVLDYESQDDDDLSFKKNELLEVEHKHSQWYWGTSKVSGNEGYIPSSFVSAVPVLSFLKKINKGAYNPIWAGRWNGKVPVTIKEESTAACYTKDILEFCHPNVVHIHAVYAPSYIVMESISQGKLNEVLQNEDMSFKLPQLVTMSTQIATGMAYLEEKNCIHRRLAARNVLVGDNFVCKISNFSAAKIITRSSDFTIYDMDNGICTFEDKEFTRMAIKWAAPEAMIHQKFSSKSDVWSYGILLTEIITHGNMPYPQMTNEQVLESVLKGYRMPQPKDCPEKFYNIMLDCWEADLERRPTFRSLQNQLEAYFK